MNAARILALDFDGVICDGMAEYWHTAWQTYVRLWNRESAKPSAELERQFRQFRPLIEVGWEMPVLIAALAAGISSDRIWSSWQRVRDRVLLDNQLGAVKIGNQLDAFRDNWIRQDVDSWLSLHKFYPGTIELLASLPDRQIQPIIITTKESRFVSQLLERQSIKLDSEFIWGKELKRSKGDSLKQLLDSNSNHLPAIEFIEDRLSTLQKIATRSELDSIELYLADWGYNTETDRSSLQHQSRIKLLSLDELPQLGR